MSSKQKVDKPNSILIVDDNPVALSASSGLLALHGYEVFQATNGNDALQLAETTPQLNVALIDLRLNTVEKGLRLVRAFRQDFPGIRVIVYTGFSGQDGKKALEAGATFYIDKRRPEDLVQIVDAVAEMWDLEREIETYLLEGQWMQSLFDAIGGEILVRDAEGKIIMVNRTKIEAWKVRHNLSDEMVENFLKNDLGKSSCFDFPRGSRYPSLQEDEIGKPRERLLKEGSSLWVISNRVHDETDRHIGYVEIAHDVSRRKRILDLVKELEESASKREDYSTFKSQCQLVTDLLRKFTDGRVRLYRFKGEKAIGVACSGMPAETMFEGCVLDRTDPEIPVAFRTHEVTARTEWNPECDPLFLIDKATEKLFLPVFRDDEKSRFCYIVIDNEDHPGRKSTYEERDLLGLFRMAVENILLAAERFEEDQRKQKWLGALADVDGILMSTRVTDVDEEPAYKEVATVLWKTLDAKSATIHKYLDGDYMQELYCLGGVPPRTSPIFEPHQESWKRVVRNTNEIVIVNDLASDPAHRDYLKKGPREGIEFHDGTKAAMIIPFAIGDQVIAVGVFHFSDTISVSDEEQFWIDNMRRRMSIALARVQQHEQIWKAAVRRTEQAHLGLLTAGFSHSLKNGIQKCYTYVDNIDPESLDEGARHEIQRIVGALRGLDERVKEIREFVLPKDRKHESTELRAIIRGMVTLFDYNAESQGVTIEADFPPEGIEVVSGGGAVRMTVVDLLQNALKAMQDGGRLSIQSEVHETEVVLIIEDSGPGLPEDILKAVNAPSGTPGDASPLGVGLYLAVSMIPDLGGTITAHNKEGSDSGAIFTVTLPRV